MRELRNVHRGSPRLSAWLAIAASCLVLGGCSGPQSALDPAGPAAHAIAHTWWLMFWAALVVWLLVVSLVGVAVFRRPQEDRAEARPPSRWMIVAGGLVLPSVTLMALLIWGTATSGRVTGLGEEVEEVIGVIGRQWFWEFRYRGDGTPATEEAGSAVRTFDRLVLPRGRMIEFRVSSGDVIHSFWVPRLGGKVDAIPGRINRLRLRADGEGAIRGQCAEFCGRGHAHMTFDVQVLDGEAFDAWLRDGGGEITAPEGRAP